MSTRFDFLTQWLDRLSARQDAKVERLFYLLALGTLSRRRNF